LWACDSDLFEINILSYLLKGSYPTFSTLGAKSWQHPFYLSQQPLTIWLENRNNYQGLGYLEKFGILQERYTL
jgi:hypothetical protein